MRTDFICDSCGSTLPLHSSERWRCACGKPWELEPGPPFDPDLLDSRATGIWRYRAQLDLPAEIPELSLGECHSPWVRLPNGPWVACAHLEPTASFKARGAAVMVAWAKRAAVGPLIEDSSGNAGAAVAAYAAAAGMPCRIYVPATAPAGKLRQLAAYGAEVVRVPGARPRATEAAQADAGGTYCSHAWNPLFVEGVKTMAFEWWERLAGRFPERVFVPVGQGSVAMGLRRGFLQLEAGLSGLRTPAIVGVQHRDVAPLAAAWRRQRDGSGALPTAAGNDEGNAGAGAAARPPLSDGILIPEPVRGDEVLTAVRESGGEILTVDDEAIRDAQQELAAAGIWVEPTGAVALAGHRSIGGSESDAVVTTGDGLKTAQ
jgi:threonine synthase